MFAVLRALLDKLVFALGLFCGAQLPQFLLILRQQVTGALQESEQLLVPFRAMADRHAGGSLPALLQRHRDADDPLFRAEAEPLAEFISRNGALQRSADALDGPLPTQLSWLAGHLNDASVRSAWAHFEPGLVVSVDTAVVALLTGFAASLAFLACCACAGFLGRRLGAGGRTRNA